MMDTSTRQPRKWTQVEDQKLREEVAAQLIGGEVKDWCRIAAKLPGRSNKDCRKRWHNSVAGGLKKGQWSKSEDHLLSRGVEQYGQKWTLVANCVVSRSADQCAKRWQQSLDPDLDRSEWRDTEDRVLVEATQRLGRHWKDIQREHFPGRSKNCIKNRYTVLIRRYQNQGITLPSAPSSPSESSTPTALSGYSEDDTYMTSNPAIYDNLLPTHSQATLSESHRSWSSLEGDAYSTWSSPQNFNMSTAIPGLDAHHATTAIPNYAFAQPPILSSNVPAASWNWTPTSLNPSSAMHAKSHATSLSAPNPALYGYTNNNNNYPVVQQQIADQYSAYPHSLAGATCAVMPNQQFTSMPRPTTAAAQHSYGSNASTTYVDPRYPPQPMYRF